MSDSESSEPPKICPDCGESVDARARICRFCHSAFPGDKQAMVRSVDSGPLEVGAPRFRVVMRRPGPTETVAPAATPIRPTPPSPLPSSEDPRFEYVPPDPKEEAPSPPSLWKILLLGLLFLVCLAGGYLVLRAVAQSSLEPGTSIGSASAPSFAAPSPLGHRASLQIKLGDASGTRYPPAAIVITFPGTSSPAISLTRSNPGSKVGPSIAPGQMLAIGVGEGGDTPTLTTITVPVTFDGGVISLMATNLNLNFRYGNEQIGSTARSVAVQALRVTAVTWYDLIGASISQITTTYAQHFSGTPLSHIDDYGSVQNATKNSSDLLLGLTRFPPTGNGPVDAGLLAIILMAHCYQVAVPAATQGDNLEQTSFAVQTQADDAATKVLKGGGSPTEYLAVRKKWTVKVNAAAADLASFTRAFILAHGPASPCLTKAIATWATAQP